MVDAHHIHELQQFLQPQFPPGIAILTHSFPVILRVAPKLSRGAEIIWRYASHRVRRPILIQIEQ